MMDLRDGATADDGEADLGEVRFDHGGTARCRYAGTAAYLSRPGPALPEGIEGNPGVLADRRGQLGRGAHVAIGALGKLDPLDPEPGLDRRPHHRADLELAF